MIVIGELINASRKSVREALENRDAEFLRNLARKQIEAGAEVIDVNVGIGKDEPALMEWAVENIQKVTDKPLAIDTVDPKVLEAGLSVCKSQVWINSISGEKERLSSFLPLVKEYNCNCIVLAMDDKGILPKARQRFNICKAILKEIEKRNIDPQKIFFDPLILPVGTDNNQGIVALETLSLLKRSKKFTFNTVIAVSNISFGLPKRKFLNQTFLAMAIKDIDAVIMNPLDKKMMVTILASEVLAGKILPGKYIKAYRKGLLEEVNNG